MAALVDDEEDRTTAKKNTRGSSKKYSCICMQVDTSIFINKFHYLLTKILACHIVYEIVANLWYKIVYPWHWDCSQIIPLWHGLTIHYTFVYCVTVNTVIYNIYNTYSTSQSTIWENILRARKIFSRAKGE